MAAVAVEGRRGTDPGQDCDLTGDRSYILEMEFRNDPTDIEGHRTRQLLCYWGSKPPPHPGGQLLPFQC